MRNEAVRITLEVMHYLSTDLCNGNQQFDKRKKQHSFLGHTLQGGYSEILLCTIRLWD